MENVLMQLKSASKLSHHTLIHIRKVTQCFFFFKQNIYLYYIKFKVLFLNFYLEESAGNKKDEMPLKSFKKDKNNI